MPVLKKKSGTYPIDRSILMDFTPSSQRGMWNAVTLGDLLISQQRARSLLFPGWILPATCNWSVAGSPRNSLTSMTWSGSAFLGGLLSDAKDYRCLGQQISGRSESELLERFHKSLLVPFASILLSIFDARQVMTSGMMNIFFES